MHEALHTDGANLSARNMAEVQTTRLLVCRALDRNGLAHNNSKIGRTMPYVQYGGWFSCSIARAQVLKVRGGFSFYTSRWAPYLHISIVMSWSARGSFVFVCQWALLGRSGADRLCLVGFLGRRVVKLLSRPWSVGVALPLGRGSAVVFSPFRPYGCLRPYCRCTSFPVSPLTRG
jgi:hypothetical protein